MNMTYEEFMDLWHAYITEHENFIEFVHSGRWEVIGTHTYTFPQGQRSYITTFYQSERAIVTVLGDAAIPMEKRHYALIPILVMYNKLRESFELPRPFYEDRGPLTRIQQACFLADDIGRIAGMPSYESITAINKAAQPKSDD